MLRPAMCKGNSRTSAPAIAILLLLWEQYLEANLELSPPRLCQLKGLLLDVAKRRRKAGVQLKDDLRRPRLQRLRCQTGGMSVKANA